MLAYFFALIIYTGWGAGDIFGAKAARKIGATATSLWVLVIGLILLSFGLPWAFPIPHGLTLMVIIQSFGLGIIFLTGNILINEALVLSSVSLIGTIVAFNPILTMLFSIVIFRDAVSPLQWIIISIVLFGVFLCTVDMKDLKRGIGFGDRGILYSFIAVILMASYFTFIRFPMSQAGWYWPILIGYCAVPLVFVYANIRNIKLVFPFDRYTIIPILGSAIFLRSADIAFNVGLSWFGSTLIAPIAGAYPSLFIILSFIFFHDAIKLRQRVGIFITIIGVVIFSLLPLLKLSI